MLERALARAAVPRHPVPLLSSVVDDIACWLVLYRFTGSTINEATGLFAALGSFICKTQILRLGIAE